MPKQTLFNLPIEKRNRILSEAINEFSQNDYDQASISRLVKNAGIAKGSFYQYFDDKKDLYMYLLQLATQEKIKFLSQVSPGNSQEGFFYYLRWQFLQGIKFQLSDPKLNMMVYRAIYSNSSIKDEVLLNIKSASIKYFRDLLHQGVSSGDIRSDVDTEIAAFVLSTITNEFGNFLISKYSLSPDELLPSTAAIIDDQNLQKDIDQLISIFESGIGNQVKNIASPNE